MGRRFGDRDRQFGGKSGPRASRRRGACHQLPNEDVAKRVRDITGGQLADHVVDVDLGGNLAASLGSVRDGAASHTTRRKVRSNHHCRCAP